VSKNGGASLLRRAALEIFGEALRSVDPSQALRNAVTLQGSRLQICDTTFDLGAHPPRIYSIAIGKAAWPMARALDSVLEDRLAAGVISAPSTITLQTRMPGSQDLQRAEAANSLTKARSLPTERWQVFEGGHPLPNQQSLDAAHAAFGLLQRAEEESALMIFLVSGGGSAMLEWTSDEGITLEDLRGANQVLVESGASITEINVVRRAFSSIKGGKLAARAPHARQITLIVSDTPDGQEASVASGPTMQPPPGALFAEEVIDRYDLAARLPLSILKAIDGAGGQTPTMFPRPQRREEYYVLLDNRTALEAAVMVARRHGFTVEMALDISAQPIELGCNELISRLLQLREQLTGEGQTACLISGGEFACPVRGSGIGGRNSETAMRLALQLNGLDEYRKEWKRNLRTVVLSAGTDGIDGNSPATGAIADETTVSRGLALGLEAETFLLNSDSFSYFNALGDAIITGPSGTNVRDLRLMFVGP